MTRPDAMVAIGELIRRLDDIDHDTLDVLAHEVWAVGLSEEIRRKRERLGLAPVEPSPSVRLAQ